MLQTLKSVTEGACSPRVLDALVAKIRLHLGADYAGSRRSDLVRTLWLAAQEQGAAHPAEWLEDLAFAAWNEERVQTLTPFLTIGETYFRRDSDVLSALEHEVLPALLARRRAQGQRRIRLWSAGCCTGEEAYSLLFLIHELLAEDADSWTVELLATDVNRAFLARAVAGRYAKNAFRQTEASFRDRYFEPEGARWRLRTPWQGRVRFFEHNLATGPLPWPEQDLIDCDLILCRNVLMYFVPEQATTTLLRLWRCLAEDGLLLLGAVEAGLASQAGLAGSWLASNYALRRDAPTQERPRFSPATSVPVPPAPAPRPLPRPALRPVPVMPPSPAPDSATRASCAELLWQEAGAAYEAREQDTVRAQLYALLAEPGLARSRQLDACLLMARSLADTQELAEAETWLTRALALEKTSTRAYWLQALLYQQQGRLEQALAAVQKVLYLEPSWALAHFTHAQLQARQGGERALKAVSACEQHMQGGMDTELVPDGEGLCYGQLRRLCTQLREDITQCVRKTASPHRPGRT